MATIGFIGGGRITRIMLHGFRNKGRLEDGVFVFDPDSAVLARLSAEFPDIRVSSESISEAACAGTVFLAVHPPVMMDVLVAVKSYVRSDSVIVSLAPKISIGKMESILPDCPNLARMNPSASSYLNLGLNPICFSSAFETDARLNLTALLEPLGDLPEVEEQKIEAYAIVSAMGPTYFWFQWQKLRELAAGFGLDSVEADQAIKKMTEGAVHTLLDSGLEYPDVVDLIPVRPIAAAEAAIRGFYDEYLPPLFMKIKP